MKDLITSLKEAAPSGGYVRMNPATIRQHDKIEQVAPKQFRLMKCIGHTAPVAAQPIYDVWHILPDDSVPEDEISFGA